MWTAFGIMLGNVMDLSFYHVADTHNIKGLNWRLMLGSVSVFDTEFVNASKINMRNLGWCPCIDHHDPDSILPRVTTLVDLEGTLRQGIRFSPPPPPKPNSGST